MRIEKLSEKTTGQKSKIFVRLRRELETNLVIYIEKSPFGYERHHINGKWTLPFLVAYNRGKWAPADAHLASRGRL